MKKLVTIIIRNNSFVVSDIKDDNVYDAIAVMDRKLTTYRFDYNHKLKKRIRVPDRKYYVSLEHLDTYIYSITVLKIFISQLYLHNILKEEIDIVDARDYKTDKLNVTMKPKFKPRDQQQDYIDGLIDAGNVCLLDLQPGTGKAVAENTLIITPNGYIKIKDLKIGDEVIGSNNKTVKVTGVYPQGKLQLYNFTFNVKDEYFTYKACKEHLWTIWLVNKKTKNERYLTTDTESIMKLYNDYEIYVPTIYSTRSKLEVLDKASVSKAVCISVDSEDKLYALKGGILTHNTFIACTSISTINEKTLILVLPKYIEKWKNDIVNYFDNITVDEIGIVRGGDSLNKLIEENNPFKIVISSVRTMVNYIKDFEKDEFMYDVEPFNLMEHLKIGVVVNDESHQEYHGVFRCMMYFNAKRLIGLSATLKSDDERTRSMYELLYPSSKRISSIVGINRYAIVKAIRYKLDTTDGIKYLTPQGYAHIKYEQSIMRRSVFLKNYINMIIHYINEDYISRRKDDDKLLIFCASINMCTLLTNHLAKKYTKLDVRRYVEDDPYENIIEADITVSTNLSAGVALDIPNLITVIQTVSIGSMQANIQAMGRLRKLENKEVRYLYLYTGDIWKQVELDKKRKFAIRVYAKTYDYIDYPVLVKTR